MNRKSGETHGDNIADPRGVDGFRVVFISVIRQKNGRNPLRGIKGCQAIQDRLEL
ncbi:hypothetical protein J6590_091213 [Homalodisca vitripennis]|nr:hypothetical protein J6590_058546 [Homalodisca vitripennis]KAG8255379.1 hypothetical protein J6590_094056 [Homalodisca vitripennis]KAG8275172.1 hypothetical protein J6590_092206 [Homalodisca vitripennis]KAG8310988.1 hypothetical protein J6590_052638 [Homalodisca vitripennis]KAG8329235.1 hypothetical protein J6590_091213 [Homalodisca vitripennis]